MLAHIFAPIFIKNVYNIKQASLKNSIQLNVKHLPALSVAVMVRLATLSVKVKGRALES